MLGAQSSELFHADFKNIAVNIEEISAICFSDEVLFI
jgi:hypothetical protein